MKVLCLLATAALIASSTSAPDSSAPPAAAAPTLDLLKALAGEWHEVDAEGNVSEAPFSTVATSAAGNIVLETIFVGTPKEMVTVYHQEAGSLALTHYCIAGNRPHMRLSDRSSPTELVFTCDGRGLDCSSEEHMHEARLTLVDEGRWKTTWRMIRGDETTHTASFELVRCPE